MRPLYIISGFGADKRIFQNIDFGKHKPHFIDWKIPHTRESLKAYSNRMMQEIRHPDPVLIGLSFGGIIAIEIAKQLNVAKIILISSVKKRTELPASLRLLARTKINKLIKLRPYSFLEKWENYNLGLKTEDQKNLVREYRKNIDLYYTNWGIHQIINWQNTEVPKNLFHLHGSNDHIFPIKNIKDAHIIQGGGHMMVMNKAEEINKILMQQLEF